MFYNFVVIQQNVNTLVVKIKDKGMKKKIHKFSLVCYMYMLYLHASCVIHLVDVTCVWKSSHWHYGQAKT